MNSNADMDWGLIFLIMGIVAVPLIISMAIALRRSRRQIRLKPKVVEDHEDVFHYIRTAFTDDSCVNFTAEAEVRFIRPIVVCGSTKECVVWADVCVERTSLSIFIYYLPSASHRDVMYAKSISNAIRRKNIGCSVGRSFDKPWIPSEKEGEVG